MGFISHTNSSLLVVATSIPVLRSIKYPDLLEKSFVIHVI